MLAMAGAYGVTLLTSGIFVKAILKWTQTSTPKEIGTERVGMVIGKCENIITVTCIFSGELTGLAIIFAAKSLVRNATKKEDNYYLCGTLLNLVFGMIISYSVKMLILM